MASGAHPPKDLLAMIEVGGAIRLFYREHAGALQFGAVGDAGRQPAHERQIRFHFSTVQGERAAVHAALHAAVDALFERSDRALAPAILRELAPDANEWHCVGLRAALKVAALAAQIVAGITLGRIGHRRANLVGGVGEQGTPVLDERSERIIPDRADLRRRPGAEIDPQRIGGNQVAC